MRFRVTMGGGRTRWAAENLPRYLEGESEEKGGNQGRWFLVFVDLERLWSLFPRCSLLNHHGKRVKIYLQSGEATTEARARRTFGENASDYEPPPMGLVPPKPCVLTATPMTRRDWPAPIRTAAHHLQVSLLG